MRANAQGVAGAAIQGTVTTASGVPLPDARVSLVDSSTGRRWNMVASRHGSFSFENVPTGGPYTLESRALGFTPGTTPGIMLHLGDRLTRRVVLAEAVHNLANIIVREDASRDAGAGGPVHDVPGEVVRSLPLLKRDFVGLLVMAPQATGSPNISISGQHPRLNAIQVDGGSASDFLGLNVTPGASVGARALSLEALQELRILIAPFDVRQGGFSGGLINAVTRSGTNQFRGATFMSLGRNELVGADTAGKASNAFTTLQYGFSAGGPIIRDRLHYFVVADLQSQQTPAVGVSISDRSVGASDSIASRITRVLRERYNFDAGTAEVPVLRQPNETFFTKLSWQPASAHLVELTTNFTDARSDVLVRGGPNTLRRDGWQLSRSGSQAHVRDFTARVKATSTFGAVSNELIASAASAYSNLQSATRTPIFLIGKGAGRLPLSAGSTKAAQDVSTNQRIIELTDNVTRNLGNHVLTLGGQSQFLRMFDNFLLGKWGTWSYADVDSLEQGVSRQYELAFALPGRPEGPVADYSPYQLAAYAQDRWNATPGLTLTAGMRVDVPFFGSPSSNPALLADVALGRPDTHRLPSGNAVLSPRLGFAYDVGGQHPWLLRGGMGGFAGHAPYVYVNSAYANTGQEQAILTCTGAAVPPPTADINRLPTQCVNAPGDVPKPSVTLFAPDFRFQQAVKFDLGVEHEVGLGVTASLDVIYTRTRNTPFMQDVNLVDVGTNAEGRVMYGRITNTSGGFKVTPARLDNLGFGPVYRFENRSEDRSTSLTLELQKHWTSGLLQVGYNWSRSEDVMSMAGNLGPIIMAMNPIDGAMPSRNLRRSGRDVPHNLVVTAVTPIVFGVNASAFFRARAGTPYSYVYEGPPGDPKAGDANGDGFANDLVYVPRDAQDVTLSNPATYAALDAFIAGESCLHGQRGRIMARNSCRNPAVFALDTRFAKRLRLMRAQSAEIGVDVFNLLNLLRSDWGITRETATAEGIGLLSVAGWDEAAGRPRYSVLNTLPGRAHAVADVSRWRMQLSARFDF